MADRKINANLAVSGTTTVTGATVLSSTLAVTGGAVNFLRDVELITGAGGSTVLVAAHSGTVYFVNTEDGAHTFTLPALTAGFHIRIIVSVLSDNNIVITAPGDNMIVDTVHLAADGFTAKIVTDTCITLTITTAIANAVVGTSIEIFCDGTNYLAIGRSNTSSDTSMFVCT